MTTIKNRTNKQGKDTQILQGIDKDLQQMPNLPLGGETYTPKTLAALIQSRIDAANAVATAKATWQAAAKAYQTLDTKCTVVVHDLKQLVIGAFGVTSVKLADFGFTPRKVVVLTPEQKAAAAAKRAATRKARNTMGPKAKLKVKGTAAPAGTTTAGANAGAASPAATATPVQVSTAPTQQASPAAPAVTPAAAPAVTVNVMSAPATQPVASPAAAVQTSAPTPAPTAAAVHPASVDTQAAAKS